MNKDTEASESNSFVYKSRDAEIEGGKKTHTETIITGMEKQRKAETTGGTLELRMASRFLCWH